MNVALPALRSELGFRDGDLQWVITGYALAFGALLLVAGRLADRIGHRRALIAGLIAFALTSLAGGLSLSPIVLVASRILQGASAALVAPAALAMLTAAHPDPSRRARAMGVFQGCVAAGASAGIVLGGVLTQFAGWRSVLLVNPPLIAVLVVLIVRRIPADSGHPGARIDLTGALAVSLGIGSLVLGVSEGQQHGFGSAAAWIPLALAAALLAGFVVSQRAGRAPMLPRGLLSTRRSLTLGSVLVLGALMAGYVYFTSLHLQGVLHFTALQTGLALLPGTLTALLVSTQLAGRLLPRLGAGRQAGLAFLLIAVGQLWLSRITPDGAYPVQVLGGILLTAAGLGFALPATALAMTADAEPQQRGVAAALFSAGQQVGSAVGLALLATIASARAEATGSPTDGYRLAFLVATGLALLAVGLSLAAQGRWAAGRRHAVEPERRPSHR